MGQEPVFRVRYWGVTGSYTNPLRPEQLTRRMAAALLHLQNSGSLTEIAASSRSETELAALLAERLPTHLLGGYGRHTTCLEIATPEQVFLIDAGSGICDWQPSAEGATHASRTHHLCFTHGHLDHLAGIPFFAGFFDPRNHFTIWARQPVLDALDLLFKTSSVLGETLIPTTYQHLAGIKEKRAIEAGAAWSCGDTQIETLLLHHPAKSLAYRFTRGGRRVVVATDHEITALPDLKLQEFIRDADLLYTDAQYLQSEYEGRVGVGDDPPMSRRGWGHSTVEAMIATAYAAGVRRLHLGHHEPRRSDRDLAELLRYAAEYGEQWRREQGRPSAPCELALAREGALIEI